MAVIGGDGTVSCAANGLLGTGAALAVLACRHGRRLRRRDRRRLVPRRGAAAGRTRRPWRSTWSGCGRARSNRYFVNIAGAGFDSEVNETANAMTREPRRHRHVRRRAASRRCRGSRPPATTSRSTASRSRVDAMLVVVGSGLSYGGGMKVLPDASMVDGVLDVCIVEALSKGAFLRAFPKVFTGRHTTHPKVRMLRAHERDDRGEPRHAGVRRRRARRPAAGVASRWCPARCRSWSAPARRGSDDRGRRRRAPHPRVPDRRPHVAASRSSELRAAGWPVAAPSLPGFGGTPRRRRGDVDGRRRRSVRAGARRGGHRARRWCAACRWVATSPSSSGARRGSGSRGSCSPTPARAPTPSEAADARRALAARLRAEGNGFLVADPPPLLGRRAPARSCGSW